MTRALSLAAVLAVLTPLPALADDVTDALNAAIEAYEEGEVQDALDELAYATQLLNEMKAEGLTAFLPPALDGWTREISDDSSQALGFMGGGISAEANYSGPGGSFSIIMMADNPMVAQMGAMLANTAIMATMGQIERINRENFLNADGDLTALIGNRILIQASGSPTDAMIETLEQIDFGDLEDFNP